MTRLNSTLVLRRTSERLTAGAAAIAVTLFMLLTVDVRAADQAASTPSISVHYSDFAFATRAETNDVYRKLKRAARNVCGLDVGGDKLTLNDRMRAQECANEALTDAVRRVNRAMLTSVHEASARKAI